jgi:glucose-1-phosphatase
MGRYLREWLVRNKLSEEKECPVPGNVYVYSNSLQRTIASAEHLIDGAFPRCGILVRHAPVNKEGAPPFRPVINKGVPGFDPDRARGAMAAKAGTLRLKVGLQVLQEITRYRESRYCQEQNCNLNVFTDNYGEEPRATSGPLRVGNTFVDTFTLQYYEGFPQNQVGWGRIKTDRQWRQLSAIKNSYQETVFAVPEIARNVAAPLIREISRVMFEQGGNLAPKVTVLVGHDSNITSLLAALEFKPYNLPGQYEKTPVGGLVMFQRWRDVRNKRELLKVEFIYQSTEQLRRTDELSLSHPPQRVSLEMKGCPADGHGFCQWNTFAALMEAFAHE